MIVDTKTSHGMRQRKYTLSTSPLYPPVVSRSPLCASRVPSCWSESASTVSTLFFFDALYNLTQLQSDSFLFPVSPQQKKNLRSAWVREGVLAREYTVVLIKLHIIHVVCCMCVRVSPIIIHMKRMSLLLLCWYVAI